MKGGYSFFFLSLLCLCLQSCDRGASPSLGERGRERGQSTEQNVASTENPQGPPTPLTPEESRDSGLTLPPTVPEGRTDSGTTPVGDAGTERSPEAPAAPPSAPPRAGRSVDFVDLSARINVEEVLRNALPLPAYRTVEAVSAHNFLIDRNGSLWAWGFNGTGQLADGSAPPSGGVRGIRTVPETVTTLAGPVRAVAAGGMHALALLEDGSLWVWGGNQRGQLGLGAESRSGGISTPQSQRHLATGVEWVGAGWGHSLAVKDDGSLWAWGDNEFGQLGVPASEPQWTPVAVRGWSGGTVEVDGGYKYTMALKDDGTVWTWGQNDRGQLGDGTRNSRDQPAMVEGLTEVQAISAGSSTAYALKNDGTVWAWGSNGYGQLGNGTTQDQLRPQQVRGLPRIQGISSSSAHILALTADGVVWSWGWNGYGQIGDSGESDRSTPFHVPLSRRALRASAGNGHSLALLDDGSLWAWGRGDNGELGNNDTQNSGVPVRVNIAAPAAALR